MAEGDDKPVVNNNQPTEAQVGLSQQILAGAVADAQAPSKDLRAAPDSAMTRMKDVTVDGFKKIGDGFIHSLDPDLILPNVAIGAAIGAGAKLILPKSGPVGAIAGVALGGYFVAKPLVETYHGAYVARTMEDMNAASSLLGDTIGGMPVTMLEAGIGAKIGSSLMGKALATEAAQPFMAWKAAQYKALDGGLMRGVEGAKTLGLRAAGIESTFHRHGFIPEHVFDEIARRNAGNPDLLKSIERARASNLQIRLEREGLAPGKTENHNGAREIYDAQGKEVDGVLARAEGQKPTGKSDVDLAYDYTGDIRGFLKDVHGRNSIDGKGMKMLSTVNYGNNFENAFWNGIRMTYGNPGAQSPFKTFVMRVIAGHEVEHGVTQFEAGTVYRNQPGALNEHFSDVGGVLIDMKALGQKAEQYHWQVGKGIWKENIKGEALRDMRKPGKAYDDPAIGKDPQPAHMDQYNPTRGDNGGVHINSGIPNRAFSEFAVNVGGNAWEAPAKIWYDARARAGSTPSFSQFAFETLESAKRLGHTDLVPKLEKAWADVGVKPAETAPLHLRNFIPIFSTFGGAAPGSDVGVSR
ncbi:MAG: hypothetical protein C0469_11635 [Cyanobacteria bacterium DS2.3.42]|nr:hypothetical protein [Cyanobacteria bacterium DS2.3.42]